ncbi:hypothetical protein CDD83_10470 [Cordyceps sp. RAO-2017]|nr:hypothetical protein CDD83_10470 [Cordyceps sp. RAO-2017]
MTGQGKRQAEEMTMDPQGRMTGKVERAQIGHEEAAQTGVQGGQKKKGQDSRGCRPRIQGRLAFSSPGQYEGELGRGPPSGRPSTHPASVTGEEREAEDRTTEAENRKDEGASRPHPSPAASSPKHRQTDTACRRWSAARLSSKPTIERPPLGRPNADEDETESGRTDKNRALSKMVRGGLPSRRLGGSSWHPTDGHGARIAQVGPDSVTGAARATAGAKEAMPPPHPDSLSPPEPAGGGVRRAQGMAKRRRRVVLVLRPVRRWLVCMYRSRTRAHRRGACVCGAASGCWARTALGFRSPAIGVHAYSHRYPYSVSVIRRTWPSTALTAADSHG